MGFREIVAGLTSKPTKDAVTVTSLSRQSLELI